ncbi:hypothetical protein AE925_14280 [Xanthomonas arboricola]|nr:hypothetical protein AE925_14280 [Xanthomonas arboricola]KOB17617.1 hypothetical protein AE924_03485 [Xanthomonas arboricola]KOB43944.1 hypothetical protein AE931_11205 [Xanthomonas arboricola]OAH87974.1 hypothetical protein AXA70_15470 [Xanthomonas arboricola pv. juglandis]
MEPPPLIKVHRRAEKIKIIKKKQKYIVERVIFMVFRALACTADSLEIRLHPSFAEMTRDLDLASGKYSDGSCQMLDI